MRRRLFSFLAGFVVPTVLLVLAIATGHYVKGAVIAALICIGVATQSWWKRAVGPP